ncbi:MAG: alpha/beta hydrolase [Methylacidiphilales bacterium]|nr:alpha/beta hydrolase [Candidatus Methylacidiphilales bacterium]NJR19107.1 alpha/beta hydrolase [Calothrix sp. CSU_2_0]
MSNAQRNIFSWIILSLSGIGLFLSAWILLPPANMTLFILAVGASEVCPWLLISNLIILLLGFFTIHRSQFKIVTTITSLIAILICASQLAEIRPTQLRLNNTIATELGQNYQAKIPSSAKSNMRNAPFIFIDAFRGIPLTKTRQLKNIRFTNPENIPLEMDIYQPPQPGKYPALIIIYGGAWQSGTPANNSEFSQYMAARGYTVFAIAYRHAPEYPFPAQLNDVRTAINFIQKHASKYEADSDRIVLMGRSAGGHLAMLAAYQADAPAIKAVIAYYTPVNLTTGYQNPPIPDPINTRKILTAFLGGSPQQKPQEYQTASPINYIKPDLPPTLLIHGNRDRIVEAKYSQQMYDALRKSNNIAVFLAIPWAEHGFDTIFNGVSNQLALYYTERFLAWVLAQK